MTKYDWLLCDADNTIFDYEAAEAAAIETTFRQNSVPFETGHLETYKKINEELWLDFEKGLVTQERLKIVRFERLLSALGIELDASSFAAGYLSNLSSRSDLVEGAHEMLEKMHGKLGILIITNGLFEVQRRRLALSTISALVHDIVISEEVGAAKPDGRIFDVAFEKMGNPEKASVLLVGDSLTSDITGGNAYGIDTCWFNPHGKPADPQVPCTYEIRSLAEVTSIVS